EAVVPTPEIVAEQVALGAQNAGFIDDPVIHVLRRRRVAGNRIVNIACGIIRTQSFDLRSDLACVGSLDHRARSDLTLDGKIELLNIRAAQTLPREKAAGRQREQRAIVERIRRDLDAAEVAA